MEPEALIQRKLHKPRRGLWAFACIAVGVLAADALPSVHPGVWFACACVLAIAAALSSRTYARLVLAFCAVLLGAGAMSARVLWTPADRLALANDAQVLVVRGTVLTSPRSDARSTQWEPPFRSAAPAVRFSIALDEAQLGDAWTAASGDVGVLVRSDKVDLAPGARIELTGRFHPILGPANPGERDARRWAAQEGRVGTLTVENAAGITRIGEPGTLALVRSRVGGMISSLHDSASAALDRALGPSSDDSGEQSRALLHAMLIGDEDPAVRPVSDDMSRLGIVHILSISGFHLVLVAMVVVFFIRLTGDRGVWEYALAAAGIGLYLLIVPAQAPVVRSGVMVLVLLLTEACGRRYDRLNVLAWTACALALWRPLDLFTPGFQLSFGVTAVLIWRASDWTDALRASGWLGMPGVKGRVRTPAPTARDWVTGQLLGLTVATALAWTVSTAVVAWHIGVLSLLGVIAGIVLTIPSIASIGLGFVAMLAALVWPTAGEAVGHAALLFSDLTVRGSHLAAQIPGAAVTLPQVPLAWVVVTTCAVLVAIVPGGWQRVGVRIAVLMCALWLGAILFMAGLPIHTPTLDRFALPKSSATLVRAADQAVLIDPGSSSKKGGAFTLRRAVAACGGWRTRTVLITGPQTERFDHLPELVRPLAIDTVLVPPGFLDLAAGRPDGDQDRLLRALRSLGVTVRTLDAGRAVQIGDLSIAVEAPGVVRVFQGSFASRRIPLDPLEHAEHRELTPEPSAP